MKAQFAPTIPKHFRSYKRLSMFLAASVVIGVLTAGFMIVNGRAAVRGFFGPTSTAVVASRVPSFPSSTLAAPDVTITPAGGASTAADNDYTRINNAVQAAIAGQTIELVGAFNWTEPNAAASWALGSDGIAGNLDDYDILIPDGIDNVTIRATSLGAATITGPGDVDTVNLEGVFLFFASTKNRGWTIENLRFLEFDAPIFMSFNSGVDPYNDTKILNNFIKSAKDSNVGVEFGVQNHGIHYSFGRNQLISGNQIDLDGSEPFGAAAVGMQSNTSGGDAYDGLVVSNNIVRVLNAQPTVVAPFGRIIGIWENAGAHTSNITVSGNQFINLAAGNTPTTNRQSGFLVHSHSSATTTVKYENNSVSGAAIGFEWLAGGINDIAGTLLVQMIGNTITGNGTGVKVQSLGSANLSFNRIAGNFG